MTMAHPLFNAKELTNPEAREFIARGQLEFACYRSAEAARHLLSGQHLTDHQVYKLAQIVYEKALTGVYPSLASTMIIARAIYDRRISV
jgi:hypothetical protein